MTARRFSTILIHAFAMLAAGVYLGVAPAGVERSHQIRQAVAGTAPLTIVQAPTPVFPVPRYDTSGTYLQVRGGKRDLRKVNAALRAAILADQRAYAPSARRYAKTARKGARGVYRTFLNRRLLSASTTVVSALIPALRLYPNGNDGAGWVAVTVQVPSGSLVTLHDLFREPSSGLHRLAAAVKRRALSTTSCVRDALRSTAGRSFARGFEATPANYQYFALTPTGLAVGFPLGQIAFPPCNRVDVTVRYSVLKPYLSKLGKDLLAGVRQGG